ncbi:protein kinase [Streptomyces sp. H10-C2]|uniref:protein kinase domain-containing protein n=1 Tax=unclassified Streptomyces TaxID=2593676 RepID=UPI0024B95F11|nr:MULTISPECIES: protein kinase [unclassified Streptomyces]MDJ0340289.1 protein kinase [Streptomyces sp. PH10-H1]MDJ0368263.1 protein kinase [Streptomyces sp. H10-C2]
MSSGDGAQADYAGRSVGGGRYVLRDLLGEGGMASVHLGHDTVLDRPVAIKTLHTSLGNEQSFRERFRREAQAVAKLNHTNIVSVFDSGEDTLDGAMVPYIVMEYVEGKPLNVVLAEDVAQFGAMPAEKALKITGDVLAALAVSHEMGLVHRDIKPGNVMVTKRGVVKVMDFGIARAMQSGVTSMTQTGMVVGTPQYLSPEQALGRGVDERSDLYSVGCMLFELTTGRIPFESDSPLGMAYQHVQEIPPAPSQFNRAISPGVDALIARALKKNPAERFPTADAMHDELERVSASTQPGTTPLIIGEGPHARSRGEGVSATVFPPASGGLHTPPPNVHSPYQTPTPQQSAYGPGTPPPATPAPAAYGYPQQLQQQPPQQQYQTPAPPSSYAMQPGAGGGHNTGHTGGRGGGGNGGGRSTKTIAIGATVAVAAIALVVGLVISMNTKKNNTADGGGQRSSTSQSASPSGSTGGSYQPSNAPNSNGVVEGDKTRTLDSSACTGATQSFTESNPNVVLFPQFNTKYRDSVEACLKAAGWKYTVKYTDEQQWGKGAIVDQNPKALADYNTTQKGDAGKITIWVSTGKAAG